MRTYKAKRDMYTVIPNDLLWSGMSTTAIMVAIYSLSKPENYGLRSEQIQREFCTEVSIEDIDNAITELRKNNWLVSSDEAS